MLNDYFMYLPLFPVRLPDNSFFRPPLLLDIMNSIVNYNNPKPVSIKSLASVARGTIFDFTYPLSANVNKDEFETNILNKFINRRLAYETFTSWQIALNVKLNEIMPYYNKLFDSFTDWNLFKDGEKGTRDRSLGSASEVDSRYSKLPQNEIEDVQNGSYMTDYTLGKNKTNSTEGETYTKDNSNKLDAYLKYIEDRRI